MEKRQNRFGIMGISLTFALLLPYQNCTPVGTHSSNSAGLSSTDKGHLDNSGQPYDGKPFIIAEACADGTHVSSRILVNKDGSGVLYRDQCSTADPLKIDANQIKGANDSQIFYNGRSYSLELPEIPLPGKISWYYQLQGSLITTRPASLYIIDMFDNSKTMIQSLKEAGHTVICTVSAGAFEPWRADASKFVATDLGNTVQGSDNEKWLNIKSDNVKAIMLERLDLAKAKGCHGIDFDSVDAYANNSGFRFSKLDQLSYNQFLAFAAHDRRLILSLNNAPDLAGSLSAIFDFAIAEQCYQYNECDKYLPFIIKNKPVLAAEYTSFSQNLCQSADEDLLSLVFLNEELDGSRYESCE